MSVRLILPAYFDESYYTIPGLPLRFPKDTPNPAPGLTLISQVYYAHTLPTKGFITKPTPDDMLADPKSTVDVYTTDEIGDVASSLQNADTSKASKAEMGAALDQITQAFQTTVTGSLGAEQAKAIKAQVREDLKADPEFRQQIRDDVKQQLLGNTDFIAMVVANLPTMP